jgi:hypothetical protein
LLAALLEQGHAAVNKGTLTVMRGCSSLKKMGAVGIAAARGIA